jgi:hypothetical protein
MRRANHLTVGPLRSARSLRSVSHSRSIVGVMAATVAMVAAYVGFLSADLSPTSQSQPYSGDSRSLPGRPDGDRPTVSAQPPTAAEGNGTGTRLHTPPVSDAQPLGREAGSLDERSQIVAQPAPLQEPKSLEGGPVDQPAKDLAGASADAAAAQASASLDLPLPPQVPEPSISAAPARSDPSAAVAASPALPVATPETDAADPRASYTSSLPVRPLPPVKPLPLGASADPLPPVPPRANAPAGRDVAAREGPARPSLRKTPKPTEPFLPDYLRPSGSPD